MYSVHRWIDGYKCGRSPNILVIRGVKQGDPMSPILFNSVIDYATTKMADHNAVSINNILGKIKYMAFAYDLVIFGKD